MPGPAPVVEPDVEDEGEEPWLLDYDEEREAELEAFAEALAELPD
jgi:hypothetical protein